METEKIDDAPSTSFDLTRAILRNPDIPATKKLVLSVISTYANKDLVSFPSYEKICEVTGYCMKTVGDAVTWFKDSGFPITISKKRFATGSGWKHNTYVFSSVEDIEAWTANGSEPVDEESAFDRFWSAYPRKVGKVQARKAFKKVPKKEIESIIADVEARKARFKQWENPQYIVYPERYLKYELWSDEWEDAVSKANRISPEFAELVLASNDLEKIREYGLEEEQKRRMRQWIKEHS